MEKITLLACYGHDAHLQTFFQNAAYKVYGKYTIPDDVLLFGRSVALLNRASATDIYIQVCALLREKAVPYMTVDILPSDVIVSSILPENIQTILKKLHIPYITQPS